MTKTKTVRKIKVLPQFEGFSKKARYKVAVSGRGSGKSVAAAQAVVNFMSKYPIIVLVTRQYKNSIENSIYAEIKDVILSNDLGHMFDLQKNRITEINTGAYIIFSGMDKSLGSVKSTSKIDICIVEEAEDITQAAWDLLIPTIRKEGSEIWVIFNPRLPTDPTAELFLGDVPPDGKVIMMRANYDQNKYLSETARAHAEHMKKHDYQKYLHVYGGQFEDVGDMNIFSLKSVDDATDRTVELLDVPRIAALDVARYGDDSCVLTIKEGNIIRVAKTWNKVSNTELARDVADFIFAENLVTLVIDMGGGHGSGPFDVLKETIGNVCRLIEFHGNSPANDNRYANIRAETHFAAKKWLETGCIIKHPGLKRDLISLQYYFNSSHQILIEDKKQLKKRIGVSPDHSDSFTMLFASEANKKKVDMKKLKRGSQKWL